MLPTAGRIRYAPIGELLGVTNTQTQTKPRTAGPPFSSRHRTALQTPSDLLFSSRHRAALQTPYDIRIGENTEPR